MSAKTNPVIAIDPSLSATAVCVMRSPDDYSMRVFSAPALGKSLADRFDRYQNLTNDIWLFIESETPAAVLFESYGSAARGNSQVPMIEFGAMLRRMLLKQSVMAWCPPPVEVPPASLKKFATGKGNADKLAMCLAIQKRWGQTFATNDEFDAYALAVMAMCYAGKAECETVAQSESLEKLQAGPAEKKRKRKAS